MGICTNANSALKLHPSKMVSPQWAEPALAPGMKWHAAAGAHGHFLCPGTTGLSCGGTVVMWESLHVLRPQPCTALPGSWAPT